MFRGRGGAPWEYFGVWGSPLSAFWGLGEHAEGQGSAQGTQAVQKKPKPKPNPSVPAVPCPHPCPPSVHGGAAPQERAQPWHLLHDPAEPARGPQPVPPGQGQGHPKNPPKNLLSTPKTPNILPMGGSDPTPKPLTHPGSAIPQNPLTPKVSLDLPMCPTDPLVPPLPPRFPIFPFPHSSAGTRSGRR